jgi:hypothetical protein
VIQYRRPAAEPSVGAGNEVELIDFLVDRGHDVNAPIPGDLFGYAITAAGARGRYDALRHLLELKADPNVQGGISGHTPLTAAIAGVKGGNYSFDMRCVELLLEVAPGLAATPMLCGTYPLVVAETFGESDKRREAITEKLLANGADPGRLVGKDWLTRAHASFMGYVTDRFLDPDRLARWMANGMDVSMNYEDPNGKEITWVDVWPTGTATDRARACVASCGSAPGRSEPTNTTTTPTARCTFPSTVTCPCASGTDRSLGCAQEGLVAVDFLALVSLCGFRGD